MQTARDVIAVPQDGYDVIQWAFSIDDAAVPWTDAVMQIRTQANQGGTLIGELSVDAGSITITTQTVDAVTSTVIAVDVSALQSTATPGDYWFDLRAFDASGNPQYPIAGPFALTDTVTAPEEVTP